MTESRKPVGNSTRAVLRTSDLARAVGVHPNTVRLYEAWGFIAPAPRTPKGYRQFTPIHLLQMRLARAALRCAWMGGETRRAALETVYRSAASQWEAAREQARSLLALVRAERAQAEAAAAHLKSWARGEDPLPSDPLHIGQAAQLLNVSVDALRNWERNHLLRVPRDPRNGYRLYGSAELGRLRVIRMLLRSGYSTMAVLRMLLQLDQGYQGDLRQALDTPRPDEDVNYASDRWLTTLGDMEQHADQALDLVSTQTLH